MPSDGFKLGLIGSSVSRSLSPFIHQAFFNSCRISGSYLLFDVAAGELASCIEVMTSGDSSKNIAAMNGINVTIPHKVAVIDLLDNLSPQAKAAGAVNTIVFKAGKLNGHNTDIAGLKASLNECLDEQLKAKLKNSAVSSVVLGTGGAARAAVIVLLEMGAKNIIILGRSKERGLAFVESMQKIISDILPENLTSESLNTESLTALTTESVPLLSFVEIGDHSALAAGALISNCAVLLNATSIGHFDRHCPDWLAALIAALPFDSFVQDLVYAKGSEQIPTVCCELASQNNLQHADGKAMLVHQARFAFELWTGQLPPYEAGIKALLAAC